MLLNGDPSYVEDHRYLPCRLPLRFQGDNLALPCGKQVLRFGPLVCHSQSFIVQLVLGLVGILIVLLDSTMTLVYV